MTRLVVIGAGGFGREVLDIVDACEQERPQTIDLVGVVDDAPDPDNLVLLERRGTAYLGTVEALVASGRQDCSYVIGIASAEVRQRVDRALTAAGFTSAVLVHPQATVGALSTLSGGTILCAGGRVTANVSLGRHVHVHVNATVGHDSILGDYTSVFPGGAVSGACRVEHLSTVGARATVLQGRVIGAASFVGAGAVVTRDVSPGDVVTGVPARPLLKKEKS